MAVKMGDIVVYHTYNEGDTPAIITNVVDSTHSDLSYINPKGGWMQLYNCPLGETGGTWSEKK